MKKLYIAVIILSVLVPYLIIAVITGSWNIKHWAGVYYLLIVSMFILIATIGIGITYLFDILDKNLKNQTQ